MSPMGRIEIALTSSGSAAVAEVNTAATGVSPVPAPVSRTIPPSIDKGQAYYWTYAWQRGEQEARAELAAGLGRTFETARDAIQWLLSEEG